VERDPYATSAGVSMHLWAGALWCALAHFVSNWVIGFALELEQLRISYCALWMPRGVALVREQSIRWPTCC